MLSMPFLVGNLLFVFLLASAEASLSAGSASPASSSKSDGVALDGLKPDRFVSSAPLVVAAACADGVAVVTTHSGEEALLMEDDFGDNDDDDFAGVHNTANNTSRVQLEIPDLPYNYRGPSRIYQVDPSTALTCVGWRTDGEMLAKKVRSLAASELERFGEPDPDSNEYGRYLARDASLWMAQCAVSDNVRALSCVGFLSCCGRSAKGGCLWLVDATGSYRVRAHALGFGATAVNKRLRKLDFSLMTKEECLAALLELIKQQDSSEDKATKFSLPPSSRLEMAVVDSLERKLKRVRQPFLVSNSN